MTAPTFEVMFTNQVSNDNRKYAFIMDCKAVQVLDLVLYICMSHKLNTLLDVPDSTRISPELFLNFIKWQFWSILPKEFSEAETDFISNRKKGEGIKLSLSR